jgi:hypothetical protein
MSHSFIAMLLATTLGQFPGAGPGASPYGGGAVQTAPNSTQAFGTGDPTYPYDYEPNWMHGYFQDIPAYHGHHFFRPYNYKHILPQTQAAAAWGIPPQLPISHPNFNSVNGIPPMPPAYHPAPYTGLTQAPPAAEDIHTQLMRIDRQRTTTGVRRQTPTQVARRSTSPRVLQAQHEQQQQSRNEAE